MKKSILFLFFIALALSSEVIITCIDQASCDNGFAAVYTDESGTQTIECSDACDNNWVTNSMSLKMNVVDCPNVDNCTKEVCYITLGTLVCAAPEGSSCPSQFEASYVQECKDSCETMDCED